MCHFCGAAFALLQPQHGLKTVCEPTRAEKYVAASPTQGKVRVSSRNLSLKMHIRSYFRCQPMILDLSHGVQYWRGYYLNPCNRTTVITTTKIIL